MRRRTRMAVVLLALGALAACGADDPVAQSPAPGDGTEVTGSSVPDIPYFDPDLAGLCGSMDVSFAEDEPSPFLTPDAAVADLAAQHTGLRGLQLGDGTIAYEGQKVGSYQLIALPEGGYGVLSAQWCYDDPSAAHDDE